jgi:hypothetical protein
MRHADQAAVRAGGHGVNPEREQTWLGPRFQRVSLKAFFQALLANIWPIQRWISP